MVRLDFLVEFHNTIDGTSSSCAATERHLDQSVSQVIPVYQYPRATMTRSSPSDERFMRWKMFRDDRPNIQPMFCRADNRINVHGDLPGGRYWLHQLYMSQSTIVTEGERGEPSRLTSAAGIVAPGCGGLARHGTNGETIVPPASSVICSRSDRLRLSCGLAGRTRPRSHYSPTGTPYGHISSIEAEWYKDNRQLRRSCR